MVDAIAIATDLYSHDRNVALSVDTSLEHHTDADHSLWATSDPAICSPCCVILEMCFAGLAFADSTPPT